MLERLVQALERYLHQEGVVADILLKSEQSVYDAGEQHEIELRFVKSEESENPVAHIHLFPIDDTTCELEVEVCFKAGDDLTGGLAALWEQAKQVVEGISITEKRRFVGSDKLVETEWIVDYFFHLNTEQSKEEEIQQMLARCASEIGRLVRL